MGIEDELSKLCRKHPKGESTKLPTSVRLSPDNLKSVKHVATDYNISIGEVIDYAIARLMADIEAAKGNDQG
jgi:hypothetical protein